MHYNLKNSSSMEPELKINGYLDQSANMLEEVQKNLTSVFDEGRIRMQGHEIDRARKYLKSIRVSVVQAEKVLKEFAVIAPAKKKVDSDTA